MDFLQSITSPTLKDSVCAISRANNISLDSPCLDYEVLNATLRQGDREVANQLLDIGCAVNEYRKFVEPSDTPLYHAVKLRDIDLVKKLLASGASISTIGLDSNTPLHLAFLLQYYEIVDAKLDYIRISSNYIDAKNKNGLTHVHVACARNNYQVIYRFHQVGADFNCEVSNESDLFPGYTCLRFACELKCLDTMAVVVRAIKLFGHCLDQKKEDFRCKRYPESFNKYEITRRHIYRYPSSVLIDKNNKFLSEFQNACFQGDVNNVQIYLDGGEYVDICMSRQATACPSFRPLHFAVEASDNRQEVVELLLKHGADVTLKNGFQMTPLHSALYSDSYRLPNPDDALNDKQDDTLRVIYAAVENKEANPMDAFGLTYFHAAIALNDIEMAMKLIEKGEGECKPILPNCRDFSKYTPLHFAVKYGHEKLAKMLIEQGADVNANEAESQFETPLQTAIKYGRCQMVDFLLARGADAKVVSHPMKWTTLHLAVERFGHYDDETTQLLRIVDTLIEHGADVNAVDSYGRTAKRFSAQSSKDEMTRAFSRFIRDDAQRSTPLQLAMNLGKFREVRRLLERGGEDATVVEASRQRTILHLLAERLKRGDEGSELVDEIVENGVDVNARDRYGFTALHVACASDRPHCGLVERLLQVGADVNVKVDDRTALDFLRDYCRADDDYTLIFLVLFDHINRLKDLDLHIDSRNVELCRLITKENEKFGGEDSWRAFHKDDGSWYQVKNASDKSMRDKEEKRQQEVLTLKQDMLTDEVSMYDYVRMDGNDAVAYLDNEKLREMVSADVVLWMYGIFGFRIRAVYRQSLQKVAEKRKMAVKRRGDVDKSAGGKRKKK